MVLKWFLVAKATLEKAGLDHFKSVTLYNMTSYQPVLDASVYLNVYNG